jgi:sulfonate transport system permease protein
MSLEVERQVLVAGLEANRGVGQWPVIGPQVRGLLSRYGALFGFLAFWQIASSQGWINPAVFPPIDAILAALWRGLAGGALLEDIAISLQRSGVAYIGAVLFSIPLGLFMGQIRSVERALDPARAAIGRSSARRATWPTCWRSASRITARTVST